MIIILDGMFSSPSAAVGVLLIIIGSFQNGNIFLKKEKEKGNENEAISLKKSKCTFNSNNDMMITVY